MLVKKRTFERRAADRHNPSVRQGNGFCGIFVVAHILLTTERAELLQTLRRRPVSRSSFRARSTFEPLRPHLLGIGTVCSVQVYVNRPQHWSSAASPPTTVHANGMSPAGKTSDLSFGTRLAALRPRDHANLLLTPTLVVFGIWVGVTSGGAPADLFSAGVLLSLAAMGGYRAYVAWMDTTPHLQAGRAEGNPAS